MSRSCRGLITMLTEIANAQSSFVPVMPREAAERFILSATQLLTAELVPELSLLLATDAHGIWQEAEKFVGRGPLDGRPFWAFAWPGGQALARYVIDNPQAVRGRRVLDLGSGSGISALAAARAGAVHVLAADVDPLAAAAIGLNARANGLEVATTTRDLLSGSAADFDVIMIADLVYEPHLATLAAQFLQQAAAAGRTILFADRTTGVLPPLAWRTLADYDAAVVPELDDNMRERARVLGLP
jgi:predicted nicotinamide N-methyase